MIYTRRNSLLVTICASICLDIFVTFRGEKKKWLPEKYDSRLHIWTVCFLSCFRIGVICLHACLSVILDLMARAVTSKITDQHRITVVHLTVCCTALWQPCNEQCEWPSSIRFLFFWLPLQILYSWHICSQYGVSTPPFGLRSRNAIFNMCFDLKV